MPTRQPRLSGIALLTLALASCSPEAPAPSDPTTAVPSSGELALPAPVSEPPTLAPPRFVTAEEMTGWFPSLDFSADEMPEDADGRPLSYSLIGAEVPDFTLPLSTGGDVSSRDLAGRWTMLDFWGLWCSDCLADASYVSALRTALAQDPDVDFLSIHTPPSAARAGEAYGKWGSLDAWFADKGGEPYAIALDADASVREAFDIRWTPTYLLVAPDLTIHGFRTDLSVDDRDGIKPVVQQIAQLRAAWNASRSGALAGGADDTPHPRPSAPPTVISGAGLAGLSGQTEFELWAVKKAFDEYDVVPGEKKGEGEPYAVFEVRMDGQVIVTIEPDYSGKWVDTVISTSQEFTGPLGERIGRTRLGDIPADELGNCIVGADAYARSLLCYTSENGAFRRVFAVAKDYQGAMQDMPDDVRSAALLTELHYLPDYPGRP